MPKQECTEIAVKRRTQRLKEQVAKNSSAVAGGDDGTTSSVPATPEKCKRGSKGAPKTQKGEGKGSPTKKAKGSGAGVDEPSDTADAA